MTPSQESYTGALAEVERAGAAWRAARQAVTDARARRDHKINLAVAGGASYRKVGRAAGISFNRVAQIVARWRS